MTDFITLGDVGAAPGVWGVRVDNLDASTATLADAFTVVAGGADKTGDIDAARFVWARASGDAGSDAAWALAHAGALRGIVTPSPTPPAVRHARWPSFPYCHRSCRTSFFPTLPWPLATFHCSITPNFSSTPASAWR